VIEIDRVSQCKDPADAARRSILADESVGSKVYERYQSTGLSISALPWLQWLPCFLRDTLLKRAGLLTEE
jgi:hypothetical protein